MRSRITIYPIQQVTDGYGSVITSPSPTPLGSFWAKVEDRSSGSNYSHNQQLTQYDYKITIRDSKSFALTTNFFINWNSNQLKIEGIERKDEGKKRFLILRCSKIGDIEVADSGGGLPGGITILNSTQGTVLAPTGRFYKVEMTSVLNTTIAVYINKPAVIDWGDSSPIMLYPAESVINKIYSNATGAIDLKVYWEVSSIMNVVWVQGGGTTANTAVIGEVNGDFASNLGRFQVGNGLPLFPVLPNACRYIDLRRADFTDSDLDNIIQFCVDTEQQNGYLDLTRQVQSTSPTVASTTNLATLETRNWRVYID